MGFCWGIDETRFKVRDGMTVEWDTICECNICLALKVRRIDLDAGTLGDP